MDIEDTSLFRDSRGRSQQLSSESSALLSHGSTVSGDSGSGSGDGDANATTNYPHSSLQAATKTRFFWFLAGAILSAGISHVSTAKYHSHANFDNATHLINNKVGTSTANATAAHLTHRQRAQKKAKMNFHEKLLIPTRNAELYYNGDAGETPLSSAHDGNTNSKNSIHEGKNTTAHHHAGPPPPPPPEGCDATIMLFRHCEAGPAREHCGYMGYQRSNYFASLFGDGARYPAPSYIYALAAGERHKSFVRNWREIETVQPLADKLHMEINTTYGFPEKLLLADDLYSLLRTGEMCGKVAILSWKHHDVPDFSHEMGCGPKQGCPLTFEEDDYDSIWQVKYVYHKELHAPYALGDEKKNHTWGEHPKWFVYGNVRKENFDPLAFSFRNGKYKG